MIRIITAITVGVASHIIAKRIEPKINKWLDDKLKPKYKTEVDPETGEVTIII